MQHELYLLSQPSFSTFSLSRRVAIAAKAIEDQAPSKPCLLIKFTTGYTASTVTQVGALDIK